MAALRQKDQSDRGYALVSVIGVILVCGIVLALMGTMVASALGASTSTRAGVQSRGAADQGVAVVTADIDKGAAAGFPASPTSVWRCPALAGNYDNSVAPVSPTPLVPVPGPTPSTMAAPNSVYKVTVQHAGSDGVWHPGCPTALGQQVKLEATGWAQQNGIQGRSDQDSAHLEVVLGPSHGLIADGPAIFGYSTGGLAGGGSLVEVGSASPDVVIQTGNVNCSGAFYSNADLVVEGGDLAISGSCNVTGNVWASGAVSLSGGVKVSGSVVGSSITVDGSSHIDGSAWTPGAVSITGGGSYIGGSLTAGSLTLSGSGQLHGGAWIFGALQCSNWDYCVGGNVTAKTYTDPRYTGTTSSSTHGTITVTAPGVPSSPGAYGSAPSAPVVPTWIDYSSDTSVWSGFAQLDVSGAACTSASSLSTAIANKLASTAGATGVVADMLGCSSGLTIGGSDAVALNTDVVFYAHQYNLAGSGKFTSTRGSRVWLITPDDVPDHQPTPPAGCSFNIGGAFTFQSGISAFIYTPCAASIGSGIHISGQVFSGNVSVSGSASVSYTAIGLAGYDLTTGGPDTASYTGPLVTVSRRNTAG
ncbi:polymer-forming cytoskeletal protein [Gryllotalpicola protaetiae]|uniref:Polymer-forming cytoskeletal protein n=1 Tax=Gryllotalpicola protaetiae TaxID=2419771 RepID=A0A387BG41_9MICO|nr:polymer-forming cytoskeletal protein [Gryllotalpicola protaetiae]AYG03005.1 hypothetical protein D7I44_05335 [Gryllotalpicola protaetiae]